MNAELQSFCPVLRALNPEDLDAVMAIEEASYPFPWTRGIFSECLRVGYACQGLQQGDSLVGYAICNWAAGESHLLNLCVHPDAQRRGFGGLLLEQMINQAQRVGCEVMFLEVRPSNPAAGGLYARRGFTLVGRRTAYYRSEEGREDALVMRLGLTSAP